MKKLIKRKLFFQNGCSKNLFLWEIADQNGIMFEVIEEFRGHSISRALLRGMYRDKIKALTAWKKMVDGEESPTRTHVPVHDGHLAFN